VDHSPLQSNSTPSQPGRGRSVLLLITGGIAAYKSCTLVRRLVDEGITVRVAMTEAATRFVTPLTFEALSGRAVGTTLWGDGGESPLDHVQWVRETDLVCVAPATADFLAKMAVGLANDLPSTLVTAADVPILVAPAMNDRMWQNQANQTNLHTLRERGVEVVEPGTGFLACGTVAEGRLAEPEEIVERILKRLAPGALEGRRVVVTAGGTREAIDAVRYIGNRSSGRMGVALAEVARQLGAEVHLHLGPTEISTPAGVSVTRFESAESLAEQLRSTAPSADVVIMAAAVADVRPATASSEKIKKSDLSGEIALERTPDLLAQLGENKAPRQILVGFALETGSDAQVEAEAARKLSSKQLDLICGNRADTPGEGFETDTNRLYVLEANGEGAWTRPAPKLALAEEVLQRIVDRLEKAQGARGKA
jgi:phosphopantothenoylcysteine decarboxylase / phosphopantothenate---cysteine ligase